MFSGLKLSKTTLQSSESSSTSNTGACLKFNDSSPPRTLLLLGRVRNPLVLVDLFLPTSFPYVFWCRYKIFAGKHVLSFVLLKNVVLVLVTGVVPGAANIVVSFLPLAMRLDTLDDFWNGLVGVSLLNVKSLQVNMFPFSSTYISSSLNRVGAIDLPKYFLQSSKLIFKRLSELLRKPFVYLVHLPFFNSRKNSITSLWFINSLISLTCMFPYSHISSLSIILFINWRTSLSITS